MNQKTPWTTQKKMFLNDLNMNWLYDTLIFKTTQNRRKYDSGDIK